MGLQHQHHKGELRETGKLSNSHLKCRSCCRLASVCTNTHGYWFTYFWCVCFHFNQSEEGKIWGDFYANMSKQSEKFPIDQIKDQAIKLQLISLQDKGSGALSEDKAAHVGPKHHVEFLCYTYVLSWNMHSWKSFYQIHLTTVSLCFLPPTSVCSWVRSWVRWAQSTAQRPCVSWTTPLTVRLWSQVRSVNEEQLWRHGCPLLSASHIKGFIIYTIANFCF